MAGDTVGKASITIEANPDEAQIEAAAVKAGEKAGSAGGKGFATKFDGEVQKGTKNTGKSLEQNLKDISEKGLSPLITLAGSLGPALGPALGALTVSSLSLGTALAGAGAAAGVFGAVFKSGFTAIKKSSDSQNALNLKIADYSTQAAAAAKGSDAQKSALTGLHMAQGLLIAQLNNMTPAEKAASQGYDGMKDSWANFQNLNQGKTLGIMADGFALITKIIPQLQPLFDVGANAARGLLTAAAHWTDSGGLKDLIDYLAGQASSTIPKLNTIMSNLARAFGSLFAATDKSGPGLLNWLVKLSGEAASFGAGGGFARWVTSVSAQTPGMVGILMNLAGSIGQIAKAVTPLTPLSVALASALSSIIQAIPVPVLTTLVATTLAFSLATKSLAVSMSLASSATTISAVATAAWTGATKAAIFLQGLWSLGLIDGIKYIGLLIADTKAWTAVQWLLDAALNANPISLIIIGLIALGAGLVLAYKNSQTFRDIVNGAWNDIRTVVLGVVTWITGTVVPAVAGAWNAIVKAAQALVTGVQAAWGVVTAATTVVVAALVVAWNSSIAVFKTVVSYLVTTFGPAFNTFYAIVKAMFEAFEILVLAWWALIKVQFAALTAGLSALGSAFTAVWKNYIAPALTGIGNAVTAVWTAVINVVFGAIKTGLTVLGTAFTTAWKNYIAPALTGIGNAVTDVWAKVINPAFTLLKSGLTVLGNAFETAWRTVIQPVVTAGGNLIESVWSSKISPAFSALKTGVGQVASAFSSAVSGVATAWNKLDDIAKAPIKFVIDTVLNKGLIAGFNWLGSKVGGPHIDPIPLPFATGGVMPGYTPGRDVHRFYSPTGGSIALSGGEAIMRPEFTKMAGGKAGIDRLNKLSKLGKLGDFASGGIVGAIRGGSGALGNHFDLGGIVDFIKNSAANAFDWVGDTASDIWQAFQNPLGYLKKAMPTVPGVGVVPQLANASAGKLLTSSVSKVTSMFSDFQKAFATTGNGKFVKMKAWIMDHLGIPYLWGGTGPRYDCSGFTQAASAAGGVQIPRTAAQQQSFARVVNSIQLRPGDLGFMGHPADHVEMFMGNGQWAEAPHTGDVTKIISQSAGSFTGGLGRTFASGGIFDAGVFDGGGTLASGLNLVRNNTGRPETVVPAAGGATTINVTISVDDLARMSTVSDFVDMLQSSRATARRTQRSGRVSA